MATRGPHNPAITWAPHLQLAWGGNLGAGSDIWSSGIKFLFDDPAFVPTDAVVDSLLSPLASVLVPWFGGGASGAGAMISSDAHLGWVKANWIGADGLQASPNTHVVDMEGSGVHGNTAASVPWYQTLALTFRTPVKRGRAHSGRMFPPMVTALPETGSPYISADAAAEMASYAVTTLIRPINTAIHTAAVHPGGCTILSPGNTTTGRAPVTQRIVAVVCDRVPDVQHRRTNRVPRLEGAVTAV